MITLFHSSYPFIIKSPKFYTACKKIYDTKHRHRRSYSKHPSFRLLVSHPLPSLLISKDGNFASTHTTMIPLKIIDELFTKTVHCPKSNLQQEGNQKKKLLCH